MFVIHLEHAPDSIRGLLSLFTIEICPYLFVSNASAKTRDGIWEKIQEINGISAVLLYSNGNEQGFSCKTIGFPKYKLNDLEGIYLVSKPSKEILDEIVWKLWAKMSSNGCKSLITHMLETGLTAKLLMEKGIFVPLVKVLVDLTGLKRETLISRICAICALHDIGKAHPHFQQINKEMTPLLEASGLFYDTGEICFRHEEYGEKVIKRLLKEDGINNIDNNEMIGEIIRIHHQKNWIVNQSFLKSSKKDGSLFKGKYIIL